MPQDNDSALLPPEAVKLIRNGLLSNIQEELADMNVFISLQQLPSQIHAFIYRTNRNNVIIVVDDSLCPEAQRHAVLHEIAHLHIDMVPNRYMLKLDKMCSRREAKADRYARSIAGVG